MLNCSEEESEESRVKSKTLITSFLPRQLLLNSKSTNINSIKLKTLSKPPPSSQLSPLLLHSISHFLHNHGFSKSLQIFLKEAHFQMDGGQSCSIDIEDMCLQYLKSRNGVKEEQGTNQKNFEKTKTNEGNEGMRVEPTIENVTVVSVDVKSKKKKKRSRRANGAYEQAIEEILTKPAEHPGEIPSSLPVEPTNISKNKKKKHEDALEHLEKDVQEKQSEVAEKTVKREKKKEKKAKKEKNGITMEENVNIYLNQSNGTIEAGEDESKKKKKQSPEESGADHAEEVIFDDSKRRKTNNSDIINKISQQPESPNGSAKGVSPKQDKTKELNGSVEPRTGKGFQRVKPENVEFADERLQDNSYWAKDGADSGYGAKAQEVLGQVRGRDFRHEKTKRKRGSYKRRAN